jgi:hypothetical protein
MDSDIGLWRALMGLGHISDTADAYMSTPEGAPFRGLRSLPDLVAGGWSAQDKVAIIAESYTSNENVPLEASP